MAVRDKPASPKYDIAVSWGLSYPNTGDREPPAPVGNPPRRNPWGKQ